MEARWLDWGARLRGLAQGGLYYGPEDPDFRADMDRVREIGDTLLRDAADWDPDRQRAWGAELRRISDLTLTGEIRNQYDLNRCLSLREIGEDMEEDIPLRAWQAWSRRAQAREKSR